MRRVAAVQEGALHTEPQFPHRKQRLINQSINQIKRKEKKNTALVKLEQRSLWFWVSSDPLFVCFFPDLGGCVVALAKMPS